MQFPIYIIKNPKVARKAGGWMFTLIGLVFLSLSFGLLYQNISFLRLGESSKGTVVDYIERKNDEGVILYLPIIEFAKEDGTSERVSYDKGSTNRMEYEKGESINILVLDDKEILINNFENIWLSSLLSGSAGLIPFVIGILIFKRKLTVMTPKEKE